MVHGQEKADQAAETARKTFEEGAAADTLPSIHVSTGDLQSGIGLLGLMVEAGFAASNGEARRHIKGGAIRINDQQVSDEQIGCYRCDEEPGRSHKTVDGQEEACADPLIVQVVVPAPYSLNSKTCRNIPGAMTEIGLTAI